MIPIDRIRRNGYDLMSLASMGMVVCLVFWIVSLVVGGTAQRNLPPGADTGIPAFWLLAGVATLTLGAQLWALSALRRIGSLLHRGDLVTAPMARAWKQFAHALILVTVTMFVSFDFGDWRVGGPGGVATLDAGRIGFDIDATQAYFLLVACLISHSIAWILKDAVDLKDDSQGFV